MCAHFKKKIKLKFFPFLNPIIKFAKLNQLFLWVLGQQKALKRERARERENTISLFTFVKLFYFSFFSILFLKKKKRFVLRLRSKKTDFNNYPSSLSVLLSLRREKIFSLFEKKNAEKIK